MQEEEHQAMYVCTLYEQFLNKNPLITASIGGRRRIDHIREFSNNPVHPQEPGSLSTLVPAARRWLTRPPSAKNWRKIGTAFIGEKN